MIAKSCYKLGLGIVPQAKKLNEIRYLMNHMDFNTEVGNIHDVYYQLTEINV